MARVLVAEDDKDLADFLRRGLIAEGYVVEIARNGDDALELALHGDFRLIILDRMMPGKQGTDVCKQLRAHGNHSMIIMLTAKDTLQDKIDGLRSGADDYLSKPFSFDELLLRVQALLRRSARPVTGSRVTVGDLVLDNDSKTATRGTRPIQLTAKEFTLLAYLMENAGTVISRSRLLNNVWGLDFDPGTKSVDVYIRYLRQKVDLDGEPPMIRTVRGFGYSISAGSVGESQ